MNKKECRRLMLDRLEKMPESERIAADVRIAEALIALPEYARAQRVFAYIGTGAEVATLGLVRRCIDDGKALYAPLCGGSGIMDAVRLSDVSELEDGRYGIPAPPSDGEVCAPDRLDMIIVPGVCFDGYGSRLGRGAGYYDRYLARARCAVFVGVCRECQLIDRVPTEENDITMDIVVTDKRVIGVQMRKEMN